MCLTNGDHEKVLSALYGRAAAEAGRIAAVWEARAKAPAILHREMELTTGLIRDIFTEDVGQLVIDSKEEYKEILEYLKTYVPELGSRIKLYRGQEPIFDHFGIEAELEI